jgi:hypothetical protein
MKLESLRSVGLILVLVAFAGVWIYTSRQDETAWDVSREAIETVEEDQALLDERWRLFQLQSVEDIDRMVEVLRSTRLGDAVSDRSEIESLLARAETLRADIAGAMDRGEAGVNAPRKALEARFRTFRSDVDEMLVRLDFDPDEIARWQPRAAD